MKVNFELKQQRKMKIIQSIATVAGLVFIAGTVNAQKAKVVSAYNYNKSYERDKDCSELKKGIESIEPATKDEKTAGWAKTWYYGGNIWFNAALTQDKACAAQFPTALDKAFTYYLNAMKFNIEDPVAKSLDLSKEEDVLKLQGMLKNKNTSLGDPTYNRDILNNKFPYLANAFVNKGVESFQTEEYQKAKDFSEKSIAINAYLGKVDSLGMYNAALASERLGLDEEAVKYYTQLTQIGYGGAPVFFYIANIHEDNDDTLAKIEAVRKGLEMYPDDADLIREELSYLLVTGQTDQALKNFDKAIANDPNNASLYYNRGLILDQIAAAEEDEAKSKEYADKAATDYKKALEVDPKFFDAAYNLGAMYYNMGVEWNNKASSYGLNETSKYKEATSKANDLFAKAQPALEQAHSIDPSDRNTMASLVKIYAIVGENDKYTTMKAKLQGK